MSVANGGICVTCRADTQYLAIFDVLPAYRLQRKVTMIQRVT